MEIVTMFDKENQPEKGKLGGRRPRYRYGYDEVGGVCGVSGGACRQWFHRRGWKLGEDGVENLAMVVRYVSAVGASRHPLPIPDICRKTSSSSVRGLVGGNVEEVKSQYKGTMNDKMAAVLGIGGVNVEEEEIDVIGEKADELIVLAKMDEDDRTQEEIARYAELSGDAKVHKRAEKKLGK